MSVVNHLYTVDPKTQWYSVDVKKVQPEQVDNVAGKCLYDARMERLKSAGLMVLTGGAALGDKLIVFGFALIAFQVASLFAPFISFPLMILPSFYEMGVSIVEIGLGLGIFGLFMGYTDRLASKEPGHANKFYADALGHWDYANHLYKQQEVVLAKKV
jgi:hypothetical protein